MTEHTFEINNNGDTAEDLFKQHKAVHEAAVALQDALAQAVPHGRNFQTGGNLDHDRVHFTNARNAATQVAEWAFHGAMRAKEQENR